MSDVKLIQSEPPLRDVEVEIWPDGQTLTLWQDNQQPRHDAIWLSRSMAQKLRLYLNTLDLD